MTTHSSGITWRVPWTEEPDRLQSIGSQRVRHDSSDLACMQAKWPCLQVTGYLYEIQWAYWVKAGLRNGPGAKHISANTHLLSMQISKADSGCTGSSKHANCTDLSSHRSSVSIGSLRVHMLHLMIALPLPPVATAGRGDSIPWQVSGALLSRCNRRKDSKKKKAKRKQRESW